MLRKLALISCIISGLIGLPVAGWAQSASDARRAIAFAQSLPVAAALAGMKSVAHLEQNLERPALS